MFDVFQVYKSSKFFTKSNYTPENRKLFSEIGDSFDFKHGYVEKNTLFLAFEFENSPPIKTADLIIIQHTMNGLNKMPTIDLISLRQLNTPKSYELFKIKKTDHGTYTIELDYAAHSGKIGIPKREKHKVFDLKLSQEMRYKLNGKSDFTLTRGKERTFHEFDFIIEWTGTAKNIEILDKIGAGESIDAATRDLKVIDERKILR